MRQELYDLVAGLVADGVPIDGVGFEMHETQAGPEPGVSTVREEQAAHRPATAPASVPVGEEGRVRARTARGAMAGCCRALFLLAGIVMFSRVTRPPLQEPDGAVGRRLTVAGASARAERRPMRHREHVDALKPAEHPLS